MKIFFLLSFICILTSCNKQHLEEVTPRMRIVSFATEHHTIGYGVIRKDGSILTATHVFTTCKKWNCTVNSGSINTKKSWASGDVSIIGESKDYKISEKEAIGVGEKVYVLRSLSGAWRRFDGEVTDVSAEYIGYDDSLSGTFLTGAIEINIPLEKGESGLPIWSLSGELIGVVSARNIEVGKSYVVK